MKKKNINLRKPAFAGSFYPPSKETIIAFIERLEKAPALKEGDFDRKSISKVSGLIVPHAGWIFSGKTALAAYYLLKTITPQKIALLGPSHRSLIHSVYSDNNDFWETPLGRTPVIHDLHFQSSEQVHATEHSLEVQLPFIQYFSPDSKILPLVAGQISEVQAREFAGALDSYFMIISTDLSHYHPLETARRIDMQSIKNIEECKEKDVDACGINPLRIAFASMHKRGLTPHLIDYSTSADAFGDTSAVVGYASFWF